MVLIKSILVAICVVISFSVSAKQVYTLKFATLIPADTAWMKEIDHWTEQVEKQTHGRLKFKIYPGGVMGDEPDVLRKIRMNQLQGAFFTGYGIGRIYSQARVLEMPFLFKNTEESDYVRSKMMPQIEQGFRDKGFELLGWPEVGFIHFFSKLPIHSLEQLKTRRLWLWQGDLLGEAFADAANIAPIPLSIIDVYSQLAAKHGSIDTVYNSPFGAMALQWHSKLKYASKVPMTNAIGSLVVSHRFFKKLPKDIQVILKQTGNAAGEKIVSITRRDNEKSIELLKQSGIEFMWDWSDAEFKEMLSLRDMAAKKMSASGYISEQNFVQVRTLLEDYRKRKLSKK